MTDHTTPTPKLVPPSCPYLGLNIDPTVMLAEPAPVHCCYARSQVFSPDLNHQKQHCLSTHHVQCQFYTPPASPHLRAGPIPIPAQPFASPSSQGAAPAPRAKGLLARSHRWLPIASMYSLVIAILLGVFTLLPHNLRGNAVANAPLPAATPTTEETTAAATPVTEIEAQSSPEQGSVVLLPTVTPTPKPLAADLGFVTPTTEPGGAFFYLSPANGAAGWWSTEDERRSHIGDSFLYAGSYQGHMYISAFRFDLSRVPRGAEIREVQMRLTGLRQDRFSENVDALWLVELLAESDFTQFGGTEFLKIFSAPSSITLTPLSPADLAAGQVNAWTFDAQAQEWLAQQLLAGATSISVRIKASVTEGDTLFAWDSGLGAESKGGAPALLISVGPPPPTPPPLPTKPMIIATLTPIPNVLTVVALAETATAVALSTGTYTPVPYEIATPTPFPVNLATVQAGALNNDLPLVIPHTPTPINAATATFNAAISTAIAQTTGTSTPMPTSYVTPILILPSPPAESILTEVARETEAAVAALTATPTLLPYNAVIAQYVIATPTPKDVIEAAEMAARATVEVQTNGIPTATPWNQVVITPTPLPATPAPPTATPTEMIEVVRNIVPTEDTPTPLPPLTSIPAELSGRILFKTTRNGTEETFALDPGTYQLFRINDDRIYPMALAQMANAPDGRSVAIVEEDANRLLQIKIRSLEYGSVQQLTAFGPNPMSQAPSSYHPAWSPRGELIAFVTNNTGNDEIFTVDIQGTTLTQLTYNHSEWDKHPSWSPDGAQIVFFSNRDVGLRRLWLMNGDGSNQRELSSLLQPAAINPQYEDYDPVWVR